jgi:hypothetical protein
MSVKDKFTPEEWMSLLKAPMLVSYAVAGAAPSRKDGFSSRIRWESAAFQLANTADSQIV